MPYFNSALALAALSWVAAVHAQAPGPANTNSGCYVGSDGTPGQTYYYSPTDTDDVGAYFGSEGSCDPGSYAQVQIITPTSGTIQCGYLPLDGTFDLSSCPNLPRGSAAAGSYEFQIFAGPGNGYAYLDFTITHTQQTETAPTPVQTVTVTPSE